MSSDVEPGDGSGNRGTAASAALPLSPVADEQGPLVGGPEVGDIYSVGTDFCYRMPDLRRLDEEVDELMGPGVPTNICLTDNGQMFPGNICVCIRKEVGSGSGRCSGISGEAGDSRGETCDTQTQHFIGE